MRGLIDQTLAAYGRIDILVNNAGAVARELTHELSVESWETAMGIMGEWYNGYRFAKAAETDLYNTEFRRLHLVALASQGRQDVPQSGAEAVFPVVPKGPDIQPVGLDEIQDLLRGVTGGHSMSVDRRLWIARA